MDSDFKKKTAKRIAQISNDIMGVIDGSLENYYNIESHKNSPDALIRAFVQKETEKFQVALDAYLTMCLLTEMNHQNPRALEIFLLQDQDNG